MHAALGEMSQASFRMADQHLAGLISVLQS